MPRYIEVCLNNIKSAGFRDFISHYTEVQSSAGANEIRFCCVAHEERNASASFNVEKQIWNCLAPHCSAKGDIFEFYRFARNITAGTRKQEIARQMAVENGWIENLTEEIVQELAQNLRDNPSVMQRAVRDFGLSEKTIAKFKIGLCLSVNRGWFSIPIQGEDGTYEDIRVYNRSNTPKIKHWRNGHGGARVFPMWALQQHRSVIIFEGEKDAMRAHEFGFSNAITFTAGAGSLPDNWGELFKSKVIYICYDRDRSLAGRRGANSVAQAVRNVADAVYIINLPDWEGMPHNADFSDWVNQGGTIEEFRELMQVAEANPINAALRPERANLPADAVGHGAGNVPPIDISFKDVSSDEFFNRRVRLLAHVIGISAGLKSFQSPTTILTTCRRDRPNLCPNCAVLRSGRTADEDPMPHLINPITEASLQLIQTKNINRIRAIRDIIGVPQRCDAVIIQEGERSNIQKLILSQPAEISIMRETSPYHATAFYGGDYIEDNRDYWFEGYIQADPNTQETILNLDKAEPARNAVQNYVVTEKTFETAKAFQLRPGETVFSHFEELFRVIESMTGIYGRPEVQMACLETIFSAIEFNIGEKHITNGWVETLIIGDTRTGKSELVRKMMELVNVGEFISCENASFAGLVGGIETIDNQGVCIWGKWPKNDLGMMALDEIEQICGGTSNSKNLMAQLSSLRSSGIAEVNKQRGSKTSARVRAIFITNPNQGKLISTFDAGIRSIPTVVRNLEDIARFTKCYVVSVDSVSSETILQDSKVVVDQEFSDRMNDLAMLTWSLKHDQIQFTEQANAYLRTEASRIIEKYHSSIPLIERGSALPKIAKLCIPVAVLCGSFVREEIDLNTPSDDVASIKLVVDKQHCEYAVHSLEAHYDSAVVGYRRYSLMEYEREKIIDISAVEECLSRASVYSNQNAVSGSVTRVAILQFLAVNEILTFQSFADLIGTQHVAKHIWSTLLQNNCLTPVRNGHTEQVTKSSNFVRFLSEKLEIHKQALARKMAELSENERQKQAAVAEQDKFEAIRDQGRGGGNRQQEPKQPTQTAQPAPNFMNPWAEKDVRQNPQPPSSNPTSQSGA